MKKRMRLGEYILEKSIAGIAFASLGCIVLIFVFVFREALPIFWGGNAKHSQTASASASSTTKADTAGASESYGDVPGATPEVGASESYGDVPDTLSAKAAGARTDSSKSDTVLAAPLASESSAPPPSDDNQGQGAETKVTLKNLLSTDWQPVSGNPKYGIWPLALGSLKVSLIAILIAGPLGILSALFTSTFAPRWAKELMKPTIEILAGIPSVVIGFFALVILATLVQNTFHLDYRLNAFLGGLAMSLAVIPIIYTLSEDSLAVVPKSYTEGSLALGATKWETNIRVVLPAAIPGIFAALLLGIGRAFGETMIVLMATGNAALFTSSLVEPVRTISASIGAEMAEVVFGEVHYTVLFLLGAILFAFSFLLNAVAEIFIRDRLMKKFGGAS
jgi:phosphate transport system permease protein